MPLSRKSSEKPKPATAAGSSVAAAAGEQVKAIIEAAEATAAEIRADAEREAKKIVADARRELKDAASRAAEATKASAAAATLLERIEAMGREVDTLRAGASRLHAELSELHAVPGSVPVATEPAAAAPAAVEEPADDDVPEPEVVVEPEPEPAAAPPPAAADEDREGARLIALNMALNGNSREDVDRYLQENFDLADRDALLDEVYSSVGG